MAGRNIYLDNVSLEEAQKCFFERVEACGTKSIGEKVPVEGSLGRVSMNAVFADLSCPHYNASAMDGIAVKASETFGASEKTPVMLEEGSGYMYVNTGDIVPQAYDAVIKIEDAVLKDANKVMLIKSAVPWQHIRPIGEDIAEGELIITSNHVITPVDIAAMLAGGVNTVEVYKKPCVGIIPTGTELVEPGCRPEKGSITDFNSRMFMGMIEEWGGEGSRYPIIKDEYKLVRDAIRLAVAESDIVIVSAGSSAGSKDYTANTIEELGEVLIHGVAIQPGKPAILGWVGGKPVVGVPGYPVSAYMVMNFFLKPLIYKMTGRNPDRCETVTAVTSRRLVSSIKYDEYVRVKLGNVDGKLIACPLSRGAGIVMSLVRADGLLKVPMNCEGYEAGQTVTVLLKRSMEDIMKTVVVTGSHDLTLDILSDLLRRKHNRYSLSSSHVGSMGGIMALKRGETHLAGIHLLNPYDGSYNTYYIKKYLYMEDIVLLHLVKRMQGFMVAKGNPLNIHGFEDLARGDIRFINRQRGSGTRMLLDYHLGRNNIPAESIHGYTREEFTHLATAAAIAEGSADTALGIYSAAIGMDLDFIPVCEEQYDLAVPARFLEQENVSAVINIIQSVEFKHRIMSMGGYRVEQTGRMIHVESGDVV